LHQKKKKNAYIDLLLPENKYARFSAISNASKMENKDA